MSTSLAHALLSAQHSRSTIHWLQSVPTPLEEKNLGTIFGVLEIESNDDRNDEILHTIGEELHNALYSSEHFSTEAAFEVALQKTNRKIHELSRSLGDEWLKQFNAIVGVISGQSVYFSHVGTGVALLLYKNKITELTNHTKAKLEVVNPVKAFQDTIAGEVHEDTRLFFSTETIYDYFSQEKIRRLLTDGTAEDVVAHIQSALQDATHTSLACAVVAASRADQSPSVEPIMDSEHLPDQDAIIAEASEAHSPSAHDSMSALLHKEYTTSQTLSGSLWANVRSSLQKSKSDKQKHVGMLLATKLVEAIFFIGTALVRGTRTGALWIFKALSRSKTQTGYSPRLAARNTSDIRKRIAGLFTVLWNAFSRLTTTQKGFIIIAIVVCIVVLSGIFNQGANNISKEKEGEYTAALSQADTKINEARAALIYDKNAARTLLKEAEALVLSVPEQAKDFQQGVTERKAVITEQLRIANGIQAVSPTAIIDYSPLAANMNIEHIALLGSSMYAFDVTGGRAYRGNLDTKQATTVIDGSAAVVTAASQASVGTVLTVLSQHTLGLFKPIAEAIQPITTEFPQNEKTITDARIFANRLYTLDTKNNQIYKHGKNAELSFAKGSAWITDSTDIRTATSFAIDGSIYILSSSGQVMKFSGGKKDSWSLAGIDPQLSSGTKIFTDENTQNIYILDSAQSRIIIFNKDGVLQKQYISDIFAQAKDMLVDEAKKNIYVLSKNTLYTLPVE